MAHRLDDDLKRLADQLASAHGTDLDRLHRRIEEMFEEGELDSEGLFALLQARDPALETPPAKTDRHFGELAVEAGLITEAQLKAALAEQKLLTSKGLKMLLGQVLQRSGKLKIPQVMEILRLQDKHVIACPCGRRFLVERPKPDSQYKCGSCGRLLEPPSATSKAPGSKIGDFEIEQEIGRGRTGIVYRARDTNRRQTVALKLLAGTDKVRFLREAGAIARLHHPHIVAIHHIGETDGVLHVAMDLVEGPPLHKAGLAQREAVQVLAQVADAVDYAHHAGVIHRDLRAPNVLITRKPGGRPHAVVLDFACPPPGAAVGKEADLAALAVMLKDHAGRDRALKELSSRPPASAKEFSVALRRWLSPS